MKPALFYIIILLFLIRGGIGSIFADAKSSNAFSSFAAAAPLIETIDRFESDGQLARADSLLGSIDSGGTLHPELLLRWAELKVTLGSYSGGAGLYCRLLAAEPRLLHMVFARLYQAFAFVPEDTIAPALSAFHRCALDIRGIDTLRLQLGLADFYGKYGMELAEFQMLASISGTAPELVPRLLAIARERFRQGAAGNAIPPARMAFDRAARSDEKALAAELLFQAYQALRKSDSAGVWLNIAGITDDTRRGSAAVLCQNRGKLTEAQKVIETMAPSFSRDTIELRQRLFTGDTKGAAGLAKKKAGSWMQRPGDSLLWRIRTLLFDGAFDEMQSLFDSCPVEPSWKGAKELLDSRYCLQLFKHSPPALSVWSRIDYDIYTGNARRAVTRFTGLQLPPEFRETLRLRVIKELLALGDAATASALFTQGDDAGESPEYLYVRALVELANGREAEARTYLLRVISDFPEDVFSEKARIALQELRRKG